MGAAMVVVAGFKSDWNSDDKVTHNRQDQAKVITLFEKSKQNIFEQKSMRNIALECEIPKTTACRWINNYQNNIEKKELSRFFESSVGTKFLHSLMIAIELLFVQPGHVGTMVVGKFLELTGLSEFVASSETYQRHVRLDVQEHIIKYAKEEEQILGKNKLIIEIFAMLDETYYDKKPWLVAMDAVSGYLFLEKQAEQCTIDSWKTAIEPRLNDLNIKISQVTSDRSSTLISLTENVLDAHSSPDLFHIVRDIGRGILQYIGGAIHRNSESIEKLQKQLDKNPIVRENSDKLVNEQENLKELEKSLETIKKLIEKFSGCYHLFNIETGTINKASTMETSLKEIITEIKNIANKCNVPNNLLAGIKKAEKVIPQMINTVLFVHDYIQQIFEKFKCGSYERYLIREYLAPIAYLNIVATKSKSKEKQRIYKLIESIVSVAKPKLEKENQDRIEELKSAASMIANGFQRSSSAVEGRNGQLSLRHHALHSISPNTLSVLTILHNYLSVREDGTTAAERLFGKKPRSLFEYLVENVKFPARPRYRRPEAA